jgi:hypothetical protein
VQQCLSHDYSCCSSGDVREMEAGVDENEKASPLSPISWGRSPMAKAVAASAGMPRSPMQLGGGGHATPMSANSNTIFAHSPSGKSCRVWGNGGNSSADRSMGSARGRHRQTLFAVEENVGRSAAADDIDHDPAMRALVLDFCDGP